MRTLGLASGLCLLVCAAYGGEARAEGRLEQAKHEAAGSASSSSRGGSSERSSSSSSSDEHHHGGHHHHAHGCDFLCRFFDSLFDDAASSDAEQDEPPEPPPAYAPYPYASSLAAYLMPGETQLASAGVDPTADAHLIAHSTRIQHWAAEVALDGGYFAGVAHSDLDMRLLTPTRVELNLRSSFLLEPSARDYALLAGGGFGYRVLQTGPFMLRLLADMRYFGDAERQWFGLEGGLGFDLFLGRPVVLSVTLEGGQVGSAPLIDARAQLGVMLSRLELFGGFAYLRIGAVNLSAPMLGARLWL